jgi:hypothetical protein
LSENSLHGDDYVFLFWVREPPENVVVESVGTYHNAVLQGRQQIWFIDEKTNFVQVQTDLILSKNGFFSTDHTGKVKK